VSPAEVDACVWLARAAQQFPETYRATLERARWVVVSHVAVNPKHGRQESVVVGRVILTGDETPAEIAIRLANHGWDPSCHRISLAGEPVVTP
jgi:hypothetical protein